MRVGILKCPTAGTDVAPPRRPISAYIQNLSQSDPLEALADLLQSRVTARLKQGMAGQRGVPNGRHARLTVGFMLVAHQQLLDRPAGDRPLRMTFGIAKRIEH